MGFTIYWNQIHPVSQEVWNTFVHRALHLVKRRRTGPIKLEKNILSFEGNTEESHETFYVSKDSERDLGSNTGFGFCKTARKPYTFDVYVCLILMFDLGMLKGFRSDDMNEQYPEALKYVKQNYALKRSYDKLKIMGIYENSENKPLPSPSPVSQRPRKQTYKKKTKTTKPKAAKRSRRS